MTAVAGRSREGVVMIITIGLTLMMAVLMLSLIITVRNDAGQVVQARRLTQCRLMLTAACCYLQETSRIGWDDPSAPGVHRLAYGWVDVRDGSVGPNTDDGAGGIIPLWSANPAEHWPSDTGIAALRPRWPAVGAVMRAEMYRMNRPPWAIRRTVAPNPIEQDSSSSRFGMPLLNYPDPQPDFGTPALDSLVLTRPGDVSGHVLGGDSSGAQRYAAWQAGDRAPVPGTLGATWFRIYRDGPSTFVVTCGAGASRGFRDWTEVVDQGAQSAFLNDQLLFQELLAEEARQWYRLEWSPAVAGIPPTLMSYGAPSGASSGPWPESYGWPEYSIGRAGPNPGPMVVNQGGTIQWIQRLRVPPENGRW